MVTTEVLTETPGSLINAGYDPTVDSESQKWRVSYKPTGSSADRKAFLGWSTETGKTDLSSVIETVSFENQYSVDLYPVVADVYWINFDKNDWVYILEADPSKADYIENQDGSYSYVGKNNGGTHIRSGSGAEYMSPKYVSFEKSVGQSYANLPISRRPGYVFTGWYSKVNPDGSIPDDAVQWTDGQGLIQEDVQNVVLSEDITLYAGWQASSAVYSVVIWKQRVTDPLDAKDLGTEKYDFEASVSLIGETGSAVSVPAAYINLRNGDTLEINGKTYDFTGFNYKGCDPASTVAADGSTVLNVYYNRAIIEVSFDAGYNRYIIDEKKTEQPSYSRRVTYRGLYEAPLNFTWPTEYYSRWNGNYYNEGTVLWSYGGTTLSFIGTFKLPNPTSTSISLAVTSSGNIPVNFYQQAADGSWPEAPQTTVKMGGGRFTITDKYSGYYAYEYKADGSDGSYQYVEKENGTHYYWPGGEYQYETTEQYWVQESWTWEMLDTPWGPVPVPVYHPGHMETRTVTRSEYVQAGYYPIGNYPDPDAAGTHSWEWVAGGSAWTRLGAPNSEGDYASVSSGYSALHIRFARKTYGITFIDSFDGAQLRLEPVVFGEDLSVYGKGQSKDADGLVQDITHDGYRFTGWFSDPECKTPYDFNTTMPAMNQAVYAGWEIIRYRVWVQPNGGVLSPSESTYFNVNWGDLIQEYDDIADTRNYIVDPNGEYSYVIFDHENPRQAYYKKTSELSERYAVTDSTGIVRYYDETTHTDGLSYSEMNKAYSFLGWYKVEKEVGKYTDDNPLPPVILDTDETTPWNFGNPVYEDMAIRAMWKRAGTIRVRFDPVMTLEDSSTITGTLKNPDAALTEMIYADRSQTEAIESPIAPANYQFIGWKTPYGEIVAPNELFTVYADLALKMGEEQDGTPWFEYQLTAVYKQVGTTSITYYANGGVASDGVTVSYTDTDLKLNGSCEIRNENTFARTGYYLTGWNTKPDGTGTEYVPGGQYGVDDLNAVDITVAGNTFKTNQLYAHWTPVLFDLEFDKLFEEPEGEPVGKAGAVFRLAAGNDGGIQQTSAENGKVKFENVICTGIESFTLEELSTLADYVKSSDSYEVTYEVQKDNGTFEYRVVGSGSSAVNYIVATPKITLNGRKVTSILNELKKKKLNLLKVDKDHNETTLPGAVFQLQRKTKGGVYEAYTSTALPELVSGENGRFSDYMELPKGEYNLQEMSPPAGYIITEKDHFFTVSDGQITGDNIQVETDGSGNQLDSYILTIKNQPGYELPSTGGSGTVWCYTLGSLMVLAAGLFLKLRNTI